MRPLLALLLLAAAPALAADGVVTKDELSMLKSAWKEEIKQHKQIESISRQWIAGWAKDDQKRMHKADAGLLEWRRVVLEDLREDGVSTKEVGVDSGAPMQERLRDIVVELRDMQVRFDDETAPKGLYKRKSELLQSLVAEMGARVDRFEKRYDTHKDRYKAQKKGS
jgi:hypothetical protein